MAFAKHLGARVIAMDLQDERLAFCRDWAGADVLVNGREKEKEQIAEATAGEIPCVVFDATGSA